MGKLSTPPPIKVETDEIIWEIEEALYNRSLDDLRLTAQILPSPWLLEKADNALILYLKSTAGMLPRLVVKITEELAISAAYHGWFTAEAEVLREIDVRRTPLSEILQTVESFPICEGVELKNPTTFNEATMAKHEKSSYSFVSSTPILPGPSMPELIAIRSKACEIFLRAGKKCNWCTTIQQRLQGELRPQKNRRTILQQGPKNAVRFVHRCSFSRNDNGKFKTQVKNPDKVLIARAQYAVTRTEDKRNQKHQRVCYKIQSGQLLVPSSQSVVAVLAPNLSAHQQTSGVTNVTNWTDRTGSMTDFTFATHSTCNAVEATHTTEIPDNTDMRSSCDEMVVLDNRLPPDDGSQTTDSSNVTASTQRADSSNVTAATQTADSSNVTAAAQGTDSSNVDAATKTRDDVTSKCNSTSDNGFQDIGKHQCNASSPSNSVDNRVKAQRLELIHKLKVEKKRLRVQLLRKELQILEQKRDYFLRRSGILEKGQ